MPKTNILLFLLIASLTACTNRSANTANNEDTVSSGQVKELKARKIPNIEVAAEAYFSPDGKNLICNAKFKDDSSYMVYTLNIDGSEITKINSRGEDACSYYFPDGKRVIWTSTRDNLDMPKGNYSDPRNYPSGAELYSSDLNGNNIIRLTNNNYYDAEVSVSPDGAKILFSRQIDGNIDLWKMNADGTNENQITFTKNLQEGGAFYMPDSKTILYRAWDIAEEGKRGMQMAIFSIKDDGTDLKQITTEEGTNWAPHPLADGNHFVYVKVIPPFNFEIFLRNISTGEETRLTFNDAFDGFPVVSPDGKTLSFSSGRDAPEGERKLQLYLMDISSLNL